MVEKNFINKNINKSDLELILEVNRKAIEIETAVAEQNEEIINLLNRNKDLHNTTDNNLGKIEEKLDKLIKSSEDTSKEIFKMQVFFATGVLSLLIQIIQMFVKK